MKPGENFDSPRIMEMAFRNIMDEIIEHAIEGICFQAHRAVKLDYFAENEFILRDLEFRIGDGEEINRIVAPDSDIFNNNETVVNVFCPLCNQKKAANKLLTHMLSKCKNKSNGSFSWDIKEDSEKKVEEEDNSNGNDILDRKKGNDVKKHARS